MGVTNQKQNINSDFMNCTNLFSLLGWEGKSRQFRKIYGDYFALKKEMKMKAVLYRATKQALLK